MVSSGLLMMYGSAAIVGPFIASAMMTYGNAAGLFVFTGITHVILSLYLLQRMVRRASSPAEQHIDFRDALTTAVTASQVYDEEIHQLAEENAGEADNSIVT